MKKIIILLAVAFTAMQQASAQMYSASEGSKVDFYSKTPVEDIEAHSTTPRALMNVKKMEVGFIVENRSFQFPNKLMQEHFNEKYMESEKYPLSTYSGKINEAIDLAKEGTYNVTVSGKLTIHGVTQERTIPGTVTVKDGKIHVRSEFKVAVKDHKIEIPKLVGAKIAENIDVHVDMNLEPKK